MTTFHSDSQPGARVLITGANGANGAELVKLFAAQEIPVRALVRDRSRAEKIALPGVEVVEGDFDRPATLDAALKGIERAFLLSPSSERAEKQQLGFVEAATRSGVRHIVKLSQLGADADSSQRFLRYHGKVEAAIRESGLAFTFLRPNLFMQTLLNFAGTIKEKNAFFAPMGEGRVSVVDTRDIAQVAFVSLAQGGHANKIYEITGPQSLSHAQMAEQLSGVIGRTISYVNIPPEAMRQSLLGLHFPAWQADGLLEEYAAWSQDEAAQVTASVRDATAHEPRSFEQFARDHASAFS